jgi:uncharacterized membrane protein YkvA (DUF1232 family)
MSLRLVIDLSNSDLAHFRELMREAARRAGKKKESEIVASVREHMQGVDVARLPEFIRERLADVETLAAMLTDDDWKLSGDDRSRVVTGLVYFAEPLDLIPDSVPGIGFLDDAVMVELIVRELRDEVDAYRDFCRFRERRIASHGKDDAGRAEWLAHKRRMMFQRMKRRRAERRRHHTVAPLILRTK